MNRWRHRSATGLGPKPRRSGHGRSESPIDLGLSLSVYGLDADGSIIELGITDEAGSAEGRPIRVRPWPTEQ